MKTRHFILAALALLCSTTLLTACGGDDDNGNGNNNTPPSNTRAGVAYFHSVRVTDDMMKYFNMEAITTDGNGNVTSYPVTADKVQYEKFTVCVVGKLPCELKVRVKITAKSDVDFSTVESIKFFSGKSYAFDISYLNAEGNIIARDGSVGTIGNMSALTAKVAGKSFIEEVNNGFLDHTVTLAFDKDGNRL